METPTLEITRLDRTRQYSYADYLRWQIEDRLDLIRGYIYEMAAPMCWKMAGSWPTPPSPTTT